MEHLHFVVISFLIKKRRNVFFVSAHSNLCSGRDWSILPGACNGWNELKRSTPESLKTSEVSGFYGYRPHSWCKQPHIGYLNLLVNAVDVNTEAYLSKNAVLWDCRKFGKSEETASAKWTRSEGEFLLRHLGSLILRRLSQELFLWV